MVIEGGYNKIFGIASPYLVCKSYKILPFTYKKLLNKYAILIAEDKRILNRKYVLVGECSNTYEYSSRKDKCIVSFDLNIAYADTKEELAIYADLHGLSPLEEDE